MTDVVHFGRPSCGQDGELIAERDMWHFEYFKRPKGFLRCLFSPLSNIFPRQHPQYLTQVKMLFTFPTTTIASVSGATLLASFSPSGVAASVSFAYKKAGSIRAVAKPNLVTECTFTNGFKVEQAPNTGILSCGMGETCIEDETSSKGGRCVILEEGAVVESHRHLLACTYKDGSSGTFCTGTDACAGADANKIGCGSCKGDNACNGFDGNITVGEKSCLGTSACQNIYANVSMYVLIGHGSCVGTYACSEVYSVYSPGINIGDASCHDNKGCMLLQGKSYAHLHGSANNIFD